MKKKYTEKEFKKNAIFWREQNGRSNEIKKNQEETLTWHICWLVCLCFFPLVLNACMCVYAKIRKIY